MADQTGETTPQKLTLTTKEAADLIGVHHVTMRRWVASGKVPSFKISTKRFINREWLMKFVAVEADR